jgi:PAS domain S-box-containing protein
VLWADSLGRIGYANALARRLFGLASEDTAGRTVFDLNTAWNAADWQGVLWERAAAAEGVAVEGVWVQPQGSARRLETRLARMQIAGNELVSIYLTPGPDAPAHPAAVSESLPGYAEILPVGLALADGSFAVRDANPALLAILGLPADAVMGQPLAKLLAPAPSVESRWGQLPTVGVRNWAFRFVNGDGRQFDLLASAVADDTAPDGTIRYVVAVEDQTELSRLKHRLDQHEHSFEHLAANTPGMIYKFVLSADGRASFPYASPGSRDIWEIDPESVRDDATPILNLIHPEDVAAFQESVMRSAAELSAWEFEGRIVTQSGRTKWFHAASRPELADQGDIVWQGLLMDITHQKQIEEELKAAKLKAEAAAQSKANFLANMSHEIRTPMNGVIGMAELLDRTELEPRQKYYVETIRSSAEVLLTIINDILDLSKIEAGRLLLHPAVFDLRRMLEDVATLLAPRAFERGLEVIVRYDPKAPSQVSGDAVRLRQVLTNLIGNAIKFTHEGHVLVQVTELERQGEEVRLEFSVADTGIGISPEAMQRIFEKFEQADASTSRKYEGTGLGLTISRQLVEMMGGRMLAESELNRGSKFWFELLLPVRDLEPGQAVVHHDLSQLRILAVDDHPVNRALLNDVFEDWRAAHQEVESGPAALAALRQAAARGQPYDVVILDYHMPGMDGLALAAAIHAEPEIQSPAMVMLSSSSFSEDQQRAMAESGVVAQLLKPLRVFQLHQVLTSNLPGRVLAESAAAVPAAGVAEPAPAPAAPTPGPSQAPDTLRVLLAEDNEVNIEIARDMLVSLGYAVDCAVNGREAVEMALRQPYDLIFMDCQMPEMDGFEATRQIRRRLPGPGPAIVAMTAYAMAGDRERCLDAGMDDYLSKPVTFTNLGELAGKYEREILARRAQEARPPEPAAAAPKEPEPPVRREPLFDVESGLKVTGGKLDVLRRAIDIWWKKLPTWLDELRAGIQVRDFGEIARVAHTIRGAASNIGALSIAQCMERIEQESQRGSLEVIANLYECLVLDCERLSHVTANLDAGQGPVR